MKVIPLTSAVAATLILLGTQGTNNDLDGRVKSLETRVEALEAIHAAPAGQKAPGTASSIVSVRLTRKEAQLENPNLDYYNLVFDIEFTGTKILGGRRIKDVKGTLYFDDAFGDEIIGATMTKRLEIGAGDKTVIDGLMIAYTTVEFSAPWKRVLTTTSEELQVRFVVDSVIYEDD